VNFIAFCADRTIKNTYIVEIYRDRQEVDRGTPQQVARDE